VDGSPWPLLTSISALGITFGGVIYMKRYEYGGMVLVTGIIGVIITASSRFRDIIREGTYQGQHTRKVREGIKIGVISLIVSEAMSSVSSSWAYFHSASTPTIEIGGIWPPKGIITSDTWGVPLVNTVISLSSGATVTWSHRAIIGNKRGEAIIGLTLTVISAIISTGLQGSEYREAGYTIADGISGTTFHMATGFHGLHAIIGTIFLAVGLYRLIGYNYTRGHHLGFEAAAWYPHPVDVVWSFPYITIYWWGAQ
jgi:cytochrome c oxidase subunit 3